MTIDFADFNRASDLAHWLQGAGLLLLGAAEAYALDNPARRVRLAAAAALVLTGVGSFLAVLALPGGWNFAQLGAALELRRAFHLFIALACAYTAAGLSALTGEALGRPAGGWRALFLALLAFAGALYFLMGGRVNEEAWRHALVWNSAAGATVLLAVAAAAANVFSPRRALAVAWAVLLMAAGLQLLSYREPPGAFSPRLVTLQTAPELPPPSKNAKPADKERPAR